MANKQYSKTIRINSDFDPSSILKGLKQIREQLSTTASTRGKGMLGNVDTEIIKLEKAISGIQNSITKGFSSSKEVDRFDREMESIVDHVLQVKSELEKVANISLDTLPKEAKKALDEASKAVTDFKNKTAKTMKSMASASFGKGDSIFSIIAGGKFDEKMFDERKKALDIQIAQQRKIIDLKESEIIETAKLNALQRQAQNSMFSTAGSAGKLFNEFKLDKKYSQSTAGRDIRATKVDKAGRTIYTQEFNSQAERQINEIYQKILQSVILTGKGYKDFETEFINQLKSQYAITLDPSTNFANKMKNDFLKAGNKYASTNVLKGEMQPVTTLKEELANLYSQQEVLKLLSKTGGEAAQGLAPLIQKEKDLNSVLNNNESALKGTIKDLNNLNQPINAEIQAWSGVKQELDKTAESQQKLDSGFDNIIRRATMLFSVGSVFNFIRRQISATYQDVQNLDKSFAQIAMVTSYHVEELWGNYNQYAQMANKLGQTTNDVIQASVLFYQQGLETNEVLSLTEDTMKLATLAGVDFADATDLMTAALRGFKLEMSEGSHVTDVYSELAAHAAASVNEIANAMNKTAAIANSAGMSFENTAAFLTQMIESTQESAANIGTALKTVIARFTELKENVDKSNSEFDDLDYNKVDKALKSVGISLKDDVGQFRDLDDVFMELAQRWETLSRNEQRYIATTAAGSRQQSRFIALMDNYKRTVELVEIAQNSEGRSSQQFAKYAESLEYKIKQLRNTWEQFRVNVLNSKFFKFLADSANSLLTTITKFDGFDWASTILIFLTIGKKAAKNFIEGWRTGINSAKGKFGDVTSIASWGQKGKLPQFASNFLLGKKNIEYINQLKYIKNKNNKDIDSPYLTEEEKKARQSQNANIDKAIEETEKKTKASYQAIANAASIAFTTAFSTAMMTNDPGKILQSTLIAGAANAVPTIMSQGLGTGVKSFLVSGAIGAVTAFFKWYDNYTKEKAEKTARNISSFYNAVRALEDLKKKEEEINNTLSERKSLLEDSEKSYKELQKTGEKLEELSKKALLTNEEQEEYLKLSNEIVEQYPELLNYYDSEGNAVINLGKAYKELIEKKKENYLLDKQQVADSEYELALNKYSQAIENYKKTKTAGSEKDKALKTFSEFRDFDVFGPVNPTKQSDILAAAAYFKEVLQGNSTFSSDKTGKEYLEFLSDLAISNTSYIEEALKTIQEYEKTHTDKTFTKQIQDAENALLNKAQEQLATRLEGSKYYQGITDVNAQKALQRAVLRNANYSLDSLQEEFEKAYDTTKMDDTEYQTKFAEFFEEKLKAIELDENELAKIFTKETVAAWHSITLAVGDNATKEQYARAIAASNLSTAEKRSWAEANIGDIESINSRKANLADALGESLGTIDLGGILLNQFEEGTFGRQIEELGQVGYDKFVEGFESASIGGEDVQKLYLSKIQEISDKLGSKNFQILMSQDWDSYTKANSEQFWNSMTESFTGIDATEFKNTYKNVIEDIFTNPYISGENLFEQIDKNFETLETNIQAYGKAIKSSVENGYIDASALKALYKAGAPIDKMVNEDSTINKAEADKWIEEQLLSEEQIVELLKDQEEQRIKQLESLLGELKLEKEITQQLIYQKALQETNNIASAQALATQYNGLTKDEVIKQLEKEIELRKENLSDEAKLHKIAQGYLKASWGSYYDVNKEYQESLDKTKEKAESSSKAITDAYDNILEKQQDLLDKQKKLNEVLYGTNTRKTSLDLLYNYKTALDALNREIERAKDILEDLDGQSPTEYLNTIIAGTHGRAAYLTAQNEVNQKAIDRTLSNINQQLGSWLINHGYGYINPSALYGWNSNLGIYEANFNALDSAKMNDDLKTLVEDQVKSLNELKTDIFENNEAIRKEQKEFLEYQRKVRDNYLSIEDEVVKKLEEYYKQQITDKKDMYDALSEADNDYLDALEKAINKQKQLRDRQDKWNSLAEKEKKYSLLARDTSGAGQKDLIKLQQDIQKDRTNLLDESVNDVVNELKELYELQKETREDEIKYQESLLENANLIQEANAIMQSWKSIDDLMSWMYEHTEGIENMSDAAIEKLSDDWKTMFDNIQIYNELQQAEVSDMFNFTAEEIQQIVIGTTEALTNESSRAITEVTTKVEESIKDAQDAVTAAMKALAEAQNKYNEAIAEFNEQSKKFFELSNKQNDDSYGGPGLDYKVSTDQHQGLTLSEMLTQINETGYYSLGLEPYIRMLNNTDIQKGATTLISQGQARWLFDILPDYGLNLVNADGVTYAITEEKLGDFMTEHRGNAKVIREGKKYASGGLVNYTGPAWVDGSSTRPEAFLNAEDTARIGEAANIFKEIAALGNNGTLSSALSSTSNNNIELHIHVDSIATESQVDYLIDRMKQELVDAASPIGANVIF